MKLFIYPEFSPFAGPEFAGWLGSGCSSLLFSAPTRLQLTRWGVADDAVVVWAGVAPPVGIVCEYPEGAVGGLGYVA